jgi:hypothetical protein
MHVHVACVQRCQPVHLRVSGAQQVVIVTKGVNYSDGSIFPVWSFIIICCASSCASSCYARSVSINTFPISHTSRPISLHLSRTSLHSPVDGTFDPP